MQLQTEKQKIAHLLRRFGLGASEAELDYYGKDGLKGAIDRLFDYKSIEEPFQPDINDLNPNGNALGNPRFPQVYWYAEIISSRRPLQKKMAIFWHDHFATSAQKVASGSAMHDHTRLLMEHATSNFMTMLEAMSKDPAMLFWLDNQENLKGRPNENFAREVMELFTMGVDNGYTERDIAEAARAFTGWTIGIKRGARVIPLRNQLPRLNSTFYFDRLNHDDGEKTILGNTGSWSGDEALGLIAAKTQTSEYLTKKMLEWFVYPNPEKGLVEKFAKKFRDSGMSTETLIRAIMESDEFYSDKAVRSVVKNPIDFVVPVMRGLGLGEMISNNAGEIGGQNAARVRALAPAQLAVQSTTSMGMELMYPPDVAGWEGGQGWISTATMVERIKFADIIFGGPSGGRSLRFPAYPLFQADPSADGVVTRLLSLFDVEVSESKRKTLIQAAEKVGSATPRNASKLAHDVSRLIFGSPEFQFA